jgi:hypothetical protein
VAAARADRGPGRAAPDQDLEVQGRGPDPDRVAVAAQVRAAQGLGPAVQDRAAVEALGLGRADRDRAAAGRGAQAGRSRWFRRMRSA